MPCQSAISVEMRMLVAGRRANHLFWSYDAPAGLFSLAHTGRRGQAMPLRPATLDPRPCARCFQHTESNYCARVVVECQLVADHGCGHPGLRSGLPRSSRTMGPCDVGRRLIGRRSEISTHPSCQGCLPAPRPCCLAPAGHDARQPVRNETRTRQSPPGTALAGCVSC